VKRTSKRILVTVSCLAAMLGAAVRPSLGSSVLAAAPSSLAGGQQFDFTFFSASGAVNGSGTLYASANADGSFSALWGSGTMAASAPTYAYDGGLTLLSNPSPPGEALSPDYGSFVYDNQFLPTAQTQLTNGGLLFTTAAGAQVNLFSHALGDFWSAGSVYTCYVDTGFNETVTFAVTTPGQTAAPVPLPASAGVGLSMLGASGVLFSFRRRLSRRPRIAWSGRKEHPAGAW
jgi:hypothetical protein